MRDLALDVDVGRERVGAGPAGDPHRRHDRHRLVPRRPPRVVGARGAQHVALAQLHAPVGRRDGHRHVPGDRARGLVVDRLRAEQARRAAVARERQVGPEPARVQVPAGADERAVLGHGPRGPRHAPGLVGIGEAAVRSTAAALGVEHRVEAADRVEQGRLDRLDPLRRRRAVRDEVDLVGDEDLVRRRREVVDHVVHQPVVAGAIAPAVAGRRDDRGLLLAGREQRRAVRDPDAVVQVDHVDGRDAAVLAHRRRAGSRRSSRPRPAAGRCGSISIVFWPGATFTGP